MRPPVSRPPRRAAAALLLGLLATPAAAGEIYRWTDAQGRVHFTGDLSQVPREQRADARRRASEREDTGRLQTFRSPDAPEARSRAPGRTLQIPFDRQGTVMRIEARLNDTLTAPFIVDTGASGVAIPQWVADRLGLRVGPDTEWIRMRTANGVVARPVVTLDSVEAGDARVEHLPATVNPTMEFGLLGGTFFNNFVYRVDVAAGAITLVPNEAVRGGLTRVQWGQQFQQLREALEALDAYTERTPETHSVRHTQLTEHRALLTRQLQELEDRADRAGVPHAWR